MNRSPAQQAVLDRIYATRRAQLDARIEDLEFLLSTGVPIGDAVSRAGWPSVHAAERALYRRGRVDLARPLSAAASRARRAA